MRLTGTVTEKVTTLDRNSLTVELSRGDTVVGHVTLDVKASWMSKYEVGGDFPVKFKLPLVVAEDVDTNYDDLPF